MLGTYKIRTLDGKCLCALYTEDFVFYNALKSKDALSVFNDFKDAYITISDLEDVPFYADDDVYTSCIETREYYLISLESALNCNDFKEFLLKCKEIKIDVDN